MKFAVFNAICEHRGALVHMHTVYFPDPENVGLMPLWLDDSDGILGGYMDGAHRLRCDAPNAEQRDIARRVLEQVLGKPVPSEVDRDGYPMIERWFSNATTILLPLTVEESARLAELQRVIDRARAAFDAAESEICGEAFMPISLHPSAEPAAPEEP